MGFGMFRHVAQKRQAKLAETTKNWKGAQSFIYFVQGGGV